MACLNCGATLATTARFCGACGAAAPAATACSSCGAEAPAGARFCRACGAALSAPATEAETIPVAVPPGIPAAVSDRHRTPTQRRLLIVGVVVAAVVLIGAIVLLRRNGDDEGQPLGATQASPTALAASHSSPTQQPAQAPASQPPTASPRASATPRASAAPQASPAARTATPSGATSAAVRFDPARARDLARAALPAAADLPGRDWEQEDLTSDDDNIANLFSEGTATCRALARRADALQRDAGSDRAGWAAREFTLESGGSDATNTGALARIDIYRATGALDAAIAEVRAALSDREALSCFDAGSQGGATVRTVTPWAPAPQGGFAQAFEISVAPTATAQAGGRPAEPQRLRLEIYLWRSGNAVVLCAAAGGPSLTRETVQALVSRTQAGVERVARDQR